MTEMKSSLASFDPNAFSVLHLNIRSMKKNFENFKVSVLVLFLFLKHGVNHKINHKTRIIFYQAIIFFISIGNIAEEEECVFLLKNRFVAKLDKICQ